MVRAEHTADEGGRAIELVNVREGQLQLRAHQHAQEEDDERQSRVLRPELHRGGFEIKKIP